MNAPVEISIPLKEAHRRAIDQVNGWRGRCVNLFARGELIIGEALLAHVDAKPLPMLLSQRIARLKGLTEVNSKKCAALDNFALQANDRNAIVHGVGRVYVNGEGHWLLTLNTLDRSGPSQRHIAQAEAENRTQLLKSAIDRLSAAFRG